MLAHAKLGASSSKRWMECPGSVRLSEGMPNESSAYAEEGTAAHALAEMCLRQDRDAFEFVGLALPGGYAVTEEMAEHVQVYVDAVDDEMTANPGAVLHVERRFHLDWLYAGLFGTCDAIVEVPFVKLVVFDLKYGQGIPVDVKGNTQARYYALGAAYGDDYGDVELVIAQPRARHRDGPVRREVLTLEELEAWGRDVLLPAALATEAEDAPLAAGEWCRFCSALVGCPRQREAAMESAELAFDHIDETGGPLAVNLPAPADLAPEKLSRLRQLAEILSPWLKAVVGHTDDLVKSGVYVPGFKAVQGKLGNRRYADEEAAAVVLLRYLKKDAYANPKIKTVTEAAKLIKARIKDGALTEEAQKAFDACVVRPAGGLVVVPEADPREPAKVNAEQAFTPIEDNDDGF